MPNDRWQTADGNGGEERREKEGTCGSENEFRLRRIVDLDLDLCG
jgi:hypothetical protein